MENHTCQVGDEDEKAFDQRYCRPMLLGSCMEWLLDRKLYPKEAAAENVRVSVESLLADLAKNVFFIPHRSFDFEAIADHCNEVERNITPQDIKYGGIKSHMECHQGWMQLRDEGSRIALQMASPMLDSHRHHIEEQAKK
jgi:hypothetical protein